MFASDLKALEESYQGIYEEGDGISCEMIEEIVEELIEECVEFGYTLDDAVFAVENAAILYIDEAKVTYGSDTESPEQRRARAQAKVGEKRTAARKAAVKTAVGRAKAKVGGAVAAAGIAGSIAKDTARRAARTAVHTVAYGAQKKKAEVKSGVKSLIGRGLRKAAGAVGKVASKAAGAASRLGEETVQEEQWIQKAIKHPGAFTKKAKAHGMTPKAFKQEVQAHPEKYPTKTERQANLMGTLGKLREEVDVFDVVLEYLLETGHAETISEAQYIMTQMDSESIEAIVEARRADKLGHERGTAANPNRKDVPHGDPSQRTNLHSKLRRRADEMGRARRNSPRYKQGGRPALSTKEKSFLRASDRTSAGAGHVRNPNVPDSGRHKDVDRYARKDQKNPRLNPKHDANKG